MLLRALTQYYERLLADPESGVAEYGFSRQPISFEVVLEAGGALHAIRDARRKDARGKPQNRWLVAPGNAKPSGSGIHPGFLWDTVAYLLGYRPDDPRPERTRASFEAFRVRHLEAEQQIDSPEFTSVCRFLRTWDPERAAEQPALREPRTGFGVFRIRGAEHYVHEAQRVRNWWREQIANTNAAPEQPIGQCLVTGESGPVARLHEPKIRGVFGGWAAGVTLASFNLDAANSYGKRQGGNAPVGELAAFRYCTALNRLLDPAAGRRMSLGETSVVCWTHAPSPAERLFGDLLNPPASGGGDDTARSHEVHALLDAISRGEFPEELGARSAPIYVLGLSPNAARVSVRFWHKSTLGSLAANLGRHYADLAMTRGPYDPLYPPLWRLLRETTAESQDAPSQLAGALLLAILTGQPYPQTFYTALLRRTRADRGLQHARAAALKACLNRESDFNQRPLNLTSNLAPERSEPAYLLGRLLSEYERIQTAARKGASATLQDCYLGAASTTPARVFPRLDRLSQQHLRRLGRRERIRYEKRLREIAGRVEPFPAHLSLRDQGLFLIGYFQQRCDRDERPPPLSLHGPNSDRPAGSSALDPLVHQEPWHDSQS